MTPAPPSPFRYFQNPHHFSSYWEPGDLCPFCGLVRPGYGGGFYGASEHDDLEFICEVCLLEGRLTEKGLSMNEESDLRPEVRERYPVLSDAEVDALTWQRVTEQTQRSPRVMAWQPLCWPAHCGDFCCFIKEAGQFDMNGLAPDGDGRAFFESHLTETGRNDIWETIRPDAPLDNSVGYSVGVYLFQCLECREYLIEWDCD